MSVAPSIPSNWIYSSKQWASTSDPLGENVMIYRPQKDTYDSRASGSVVKIVADSSSSWMRPARTYLSFDVHVFNSDGSAYTTPSLSDAGGMSLFKSLLVKAGGKNVHQFDDLPQYLSDYYNTSLSVNQRAWVAQLEGLNTPTFSNGGTFTVRHMMTSYGFFNPIFGQPIPLAHLPNQAIELQYSMNTGNAAFVGAPANTYFTISNVRLVTQLVTPPASVMSDVWNGVSHGKALEYSYIDTKQITSVCSGASQNTFYLPVGQTNLVGLSMSFRSDTDYADSTKDRALIHGTQNLVSWRIQIGQFRAPLTEDFQVADTVINNALTLNNAQDLQSQNVDFANYYNKRFYFAYSFQSKDENSDSALSTVGSDGLIRVITQHSSPPPSTSVSLITNVYSNRTLLVGSSVDVI